MREVIVILDNIRSAHNVGAIFRTCDGAGIQKIYLCGITPYPPHPKILKTAIGAEEYIEWEHAKEIKNVILEIKAKGFEVIAVEQTDKAIDYFSQSYPQKIALIFGHELTGVSLEALELSDRHIMLRMHGKKKSLNVATTTGIITFHIINSQ